MPTEWPPICDRPRTFTPRPPEGICTGAGIALARARSRPGTAKSCGNAAKAASSGTVARNPRRSRLPARVATGCGIFIRRSRFGPVYAAAAEAMRRILINRARDQKRMKRGGGRLRLELLDHADSICEDADFVLSLDEVLARLADEDPTSGQIAQLHLFGGLSVEEAGQAMAISRAVAYRNWKYARAWLRDALRDALEK